MPLKRSLLHENTNPFGKAVFPVRVISRLEAIPEDIGEQVVAPRFKASHEGVYDVVGGGAGFAVYQLDEQLAL